MVGMEVLEEVNTSHEPAGPPPPTSLRNPLVGSQTDISQEFKLAPGIHVILFPLYPE